MINPRATLHDVVLDDDDGRGGTPSTAEPGGARSGPVRRFARRWRWPLAGVVVLSLAATSVVGSRREAARLADLADVPGVLAPLDGPVRELWTTSYYPFPSSWDLGGVLVGVSFDMAAINEVVDGVEAAALPEPKARGVDARTGQELWSMTLGGQSGGTQCVPATGPVEGPGQAVLVCVVVDEAATTRGTVDGAEPAPGESAWQPPARVHLAVLDPRTGRVLRELPAAPGNGIAPLGADVARTSAEAGGNTVTRVDPRTGTEVWTSTHPAETGALAQSAWAEPYRGGLLVSAGSQAWVLSASGELVDEWHVATDDGWSLFQAGGHLLRAAYEPNAERVVVTDLATDVTITPSADFSPWQGVDDGSVPGVLFTAGAGLTAWDLGTGQRRWEVEGVADSAIVLDGVVYSIGSGIVSALDPMSGTELWTVRADLSGPYDLATDGSSLLILGRVSGSATSTVRAMNRTDGSTQWDAPLTHPVQSLEVSAGHLFAQTDQGVFVALG